MGYRLFLYHFELDEHQNSPHTMRRFSEALRAYFEGRGLDYGMSALGGAIHCRGCIFEKGRALTEDDRRQLADWARGQRVRCTARIGALQEDRDDLPIFREVTEWVFAIDNLTDEDRAEASAWHEGIRRWMCEPQKDPSS